MSLLHITSSASPTPSTSTLLGAELCEKLGGDRVTRDTTHDIPHIDQTWTAANFTPASDRTPAQRATLALSDTFISEIIKADTLVLSAPMYNFAIPSSLKAWIDHICRSGITFSYTPDGPKGLLTGKRAFLVISSGGTPVEGAADKATNYLRHVMGFIGIQDVHVIAADQMAVDADKALMDARTAITAL